MTLKTESVAVPSSKIVESRVDWLGSLLRKNSTFGSPQKTYVSTEKRSDAT